MDPIFLSSFIAGLYLSVTIPGCGPVLYPGSQTTGSAGRRFWGPNRMPGLLRDQLLHRLVEQKPPHTDIEQQANTDGDG
jgi:hypothetical protein